MCIVCNAIGYNHNDLNGPGSSLAFNDPLSSWGASSSNAKNEDSFNSQESPSLFKDATSSSTTLNFNEGDNIIIPSEDGSTLRGLTGNDTYILSSKTIEPNSKIQIVDTEGKNIIQLVDGLIISDSIFSKNATKLSLSNGSEITINGADKFTFELSGNLTSGTVGVNKTFSEFATYMGIDSLPESGSQSGSSNITIDELRTKTKTDLKTFLSGDTRTIQSTETLEVDLNNYASFPKAPNFSESTTDLSNRDDLSGLDSIVLYQDYEKATIAIRADKKGIKVFDTSFLNVNSEFTDGSRSHQWKVGEENLIYEVFRNYEFNSTTAWQIENVSTSGFYDFYDVTPNSISLGSGSFFDSKTNKLNFINYNNPNYGDYTKSIDTYFDTENAHKIKYWWKGDDDKWNTYLITIDSVFDDSSDISIYEDKAEVLQNVSNTIEYEIRDNSYPHITRDQITIDGSNLTIVGGEENSETFNAKVTVRAFFKFANGYTFENEEDNYEDIEITVRLTDDDYIRTQSSKIIEDGNTETSISIIEDNPGDILLDLKDFNIDPGSAKIKDIKINYKSDKSFFDQFISEIFYIDKDVLKFSEVALYDYDGDRIIFIHHSKNNPNDSSVDTFGFSYGIDYVTENIRNNDFEITFTYTSNNEEFEHTLKIVDYEDTDTGSFFTADYYLDYGNQSYDNKFINALKSDTRLSHANPDVDSVALTKDEWSNYETIVTYAFIEPSVIPISAFQTFLDTCYFTPYTSLDTLWTPNDNAKNMVIEILDRTSELFKITFVESNNYEDAQLRFNWYETTSSFTGMSGWAYLPSAQRTDIFFNIGDTRHYEEGNYLFFQTYPDGIFANLARHELGHSLGLGHPFTHFLNSNYVEDYDQNNYPEYYYANTLFTTMAYATFWDKNLDKYEENDAKYYSSSYNLGALPDYIGTSWVGIWQSNWARDDILTLGDMYGLRKNYNAEDTIYSWNKDKLIYETLHDMGGNDTIDLSNYDWDMQIDLNPGAVSEVGINQNRMAWSGEPLEDETDKTGDVFILSWSTVIENYVGSKGSDDVTLNTSIINTITTGDGDDVVRDVLPTDIVNTGAGEDTIYLSYTTLDPATDVSIDGGSEADSFDLVIYDLQPDIEVDFTQSRTTFVNFEGHNFTDNEKQTIILDNEDFITINSQTLTIQGDSNDEISLPEDAAQARYDDLYLYYTLNDIEVAISVDLLLV